MDFREITEFFKDMFVYIVVIIAILFTALYVVTIQQVVGPSMDDTLKNGDLLLLDRLTYRFSQIKRNDIVAIYYADTKYMIKRVIGLPGEVVTFKNNVLYINNEATPEPYLAEGVVTGDFSLSEIGYSVIPEDMYFVLGDNRGDSMDSRDMRVGLIKKESFLGKIRARFWPLNKFKLIKK